ncbi:MAG: NAD-dependent epimerase/dehydratase family protein [Candidatus Omnitrophota bacterium]
MKALVTGCAGFIGSQLCERLAERGDSVIGVDCFTSYYAEQRKRANLAALMARPNFTLVEGDLLALDLKNLLSPVDCVFHTAGQPGVRGSWGGQFDEYVRNNILATQRLLEAVKSNGGHTKVVFSSSSSIYGNVERLPVSESDLPRPFSPYGTTKLAAEHLCMLYHANYGVSIVSLRYFTVYGPRQRPDMAFHIFIKALLQNAPIILHGDGCQTRDFTYVDDIVDANLAAADKPVAGEIFNIGGGSRQSLRDAIAILERISGQKADLDCRPAIYGDVRDTWADTERARQYLGFQPKVALDEGLKRQFEWEKTIYPPQD